MVTDNNPIARPGGSPVETLTNLCATYADKDETGKTMADQVPASNDASDNDEFSIVARTGWDRFSKFLMMNVIAVVAALLLIGAFTVWS